MLTRVVLASLALGIVTIPIGAVLAETIEFNFTYTEEDLTITRDGEGFDHFAIDGTRADLRRPGAPALPMRVATVVLPPGAAVRDTRVVITDRQVLEGRFRPAPAPDEGGNRVPLDEYYEGRYAAYPDETAEYGEELTIVGGVQILRLFVSPLVWHPQAAAIELLESISIEVTTEGRGTPPLTRRPDGGYTIRAHTRD
jgi:hypothetical protein